MKTDSMLFLYSHQQLDIFANLSQEAALAIRQLCGELADRKPTGDRADLILFASRLAEEIDRATDSAFLSGDLVSDGYLVRSSGEPR